MCYICTRNEEQLAYGVMVTLLFLVQSFKVRVLVSQTLGGNDGAYDRDVGFPQLAPFPGES